MNYIYKIALFLVLVFSISLSLKAQEMMEENDNFSSKIGKSPEAYAFESYSGNKPDLYRGSHDVSYKLNSFELDGRTFDLSLVYASSGLKVDQESSVVGLGWHINSHGMITRQIKDVDDFKQANNIDYGWVYQKDYEDEIRNDPIADILTSEGIKGDIFSASGSAKPDLIPDIFNVNIFGENYSFILKKLQTTGTTNLVEGAAINKPTYKISYNLSDKSFTIVDDYGFEFYFGTYNSSDMEMGCSTNLEYDVITSWLLTSITSPLNNEITIDYSNAVSIVSQPQYVENYGFSICTRAFYMNQIQGPPLLSCELVSTHEERYPVRINVSDTEKIDFNYVDRKDLDSSPAAKKLNAIQQIYDSKIVEEITFQSSYFNSQYVGTSEESDFLRVKLNGFMMQGNHYRFSYNNPTSLPSKESKSYDYWGFYNGSTPDFLYPPFTGRLVESPLRYAFLAPWNANCPKEEYLSLQGSVRMPNEAYSQIGLLNKIIYPTGGFSTYEYENNTIRKDYDSWDYWEGDRIINSTNYDNYESTNRYIDIYNSQTVDLKDVENALNFIKIQIQNPYKGQYFNVCQYIDDNDLYTETLLAFVPEGAGYDIKRITYADYISSLYSIVGVQCDYTEGAKHSIYYDNIVGELQQGDYTLYLKGDPHIKIDVELHLNDGSIRYRNMDVGGVRISKVNDFDFDNTLQKIKEYKYVEDEYSSGKLFSNLRFHSVRETYVGSTVGYTRESARKDLMITSESMHNKSRFHVGYDRVEEIITDYKKNVSFSVEYLFYNDVFSAGYINKRVILHPKDFFEMNVTTTSSLNYSWNTGNYSNNPNYGWSLVPLTRNGKLKKIIKRNSNHDIISIEKYNYTQLKNGYVSAATAEVASYNANGTSGFSALTGYKFYKVELADHKLVSKETLYLSDGFEKSINTDFDYNDNFQLASKTTSTSDGLGDHMEMNKEEYFYPYDMTGSNYGNLVSQNRIANPVEIDIYKNDIKVDGISTNYGYYNGYLHPSIKSKYNPDKNEYEEEVNFLSYNIKGKPEKYSGSDGKIIDLKWGYNQEYPVIQVENLNTGTNLNTAITNVLPTGYTTFESLLTSLTSIASTSTEQSRWKNFNNSLRSNNSGAFFTTFTYKPLVGMTSKTDSMGNTTYFIYDEFNRLSKIKDQDGHVLKEFEYNYSDPHRPIR